MTLEQELRDSLGIEELESHIIELKHCIRSLVERQQVLEDLLVAHALDKEDRNEIKKAIAAGKLRIV